MLENQQRPIKTTEFMLVSAIYENKDATCLRPILASTQTNSQQIDLSLNEECCVCFF